MCAGEATNKWKLPELEAVPRLAIYCDWSALLNDELIFCWAKLADIVVDTSVAGLYVPNWKLPYTTSSL